MGLFSKKNQKNQTVSVPKPIAGPSVPPPGAPKPATGPSFGLGTSTPPAPGAVPPPPGGIPPPPGAPKPVVGPTFGPSNSTPPAGGFKPMNNGPTFGNQANPSGPSFGISNPAANAANDVPQRKFDIFNENQRYVNFDFSKLKIDKLDLSTNPEPRQIRKHIKKLLELQKQLINMEKDLVCRRDFIDKYIFEEKENQKPKILVDLLAGKNPEEAEKEKNVENKTDESNLENSNDKKVETKKETIKDSSKKQELANDSKEKKVDKKESSELKKDYKETKNNKNSLDDDIFKSVEAMLSSK